MTITRWPAKVGRIPHAASSPNPIRLDHRWHPEKPERYAWTEFCGLRMFVTRRQANLQAADAVKFYELHQSRMLLAMFPTFFRDSSGLPSGREDHRRLR